MLKLSLLLLFYLIKTSKGYVSNEIFSILPDAMKDISTLSNGTRDTSLATFPNHNSIESARFSNKSLLKIPILDSNFSSLICFPTSDEDYKNVYILAHLTCRMMGFMTFSSMRAKMSPHNRARIKPKNVICSDGLQRGASSCESLQDETEKCRMVTEVICGACSGTSKGFRGVIKSPGFPLASFGDVTCEWNVMVPEHHGIILSFNQFNAMDMKSVDLPCSLHRPYIYIMYGLQSKVTIHRYCQLDEVKNLSIPFHTVKIIVFTGIQTRQKASLLNSELGFTISFEATAPGAENYGSPLKMLAFFLLGVVFIACMILCHYIQKYKLCDCVAKNHDRQLLVHPMEQAYDMHISNKTRLENLKRNAKEEGAKAEKVEFQRNPKMVYETGKGFNEYSSLLDSSARFIPSLTRRNSAEDKEKLNSNLHKKLNLMHSYHGQEDSNRLSVASPKNYYDYPSLMASKHAFSESSMEERKKKLKISMSSC